MSDLTYSQVAAVQLDVAPDAARFVARRPSRLVLCDRSRQFANIEERAAQVNAWSVGQTE